MKKAFITLFLIIFVSTYSQSSAKFWLTPDGKKIKNKNMGEVSKKFPDFSMGFRKTMDSGLVYQYNIPTYEKYLVKYDYIKNKIKDLSNQKFSDSTIYIIYYHFKDDKCSSFFTNYMTKDRIKDNKIASDFYKFNIETVKNVKYLILFENGITLKNDINSEDEYYFKDKNNFFRNNLFKKPTLCGSFCIIKPNGQTLVRNGEYRADWMVNHLNPEIWNQIFGKENK